MEPPFVFPKPIQVKVEESEIIDLDFYKTPQEAVKEWDEKVDVKFKKYIIVDCERNLDVLMKWYIQSLTEEAGNLEHLESLKISMVKHLYFFKLYFTELNCCFADNYLNNMEEILTFYCDIEIKAIPSKENTKRRAYKRTLQMICHGLISKLTLYLMNREDHIFHVVMKVKLDEKSEENKDLLNLLYGNFLAKKPANTSDLAFCRAYILYQQWKVIRKEEEREDMDKVMYEMYGRTPKTIQNNSTLKQILLPKCSSTLNVLLHLQDTSHVIATEYFNFIKSKNIQEDSEYVPDVDVVELDDGILPDMANDGEDEEFNREYSSFVKTMSAIAIEDDPSDCQIVGVTSLGFDMESTELVHEVVEDDDIEEIIYFTPKVQVLSKKDMCSKEKYTKVASPEFSFLDSIQITGSDEVPVEKVSSSMPSLKNALKKSNKSSDIKLEEPDCNCLLPNNFSRTNNNSSCTSTTAIKKCPERSSIGTSFLELDNELSCHSDVSVVEVTAAMETSPQSPPKIKKCLVSIETQTEEFGEVQICDKDGEKPLEKPLVQPNCYLTPPSDQPFDEHNRTVESPLYPDIYANIVRTSDSSDEMDCSAKEPELDYSPSMEESDAENDNGPLLTDNQVDNILPATRQSTSEEEENVDYDSNTHYESEHEMNTVEPLDVTLDICSSGTGQVSDKSEPMLSVDDLSNHEEESRSSELNDIPQSNKVSESCPYKTESVKVAVMTPLQISTNSDGSCTSSDTRTPKKLLTTLPHSVFSNNNQDVVDKPQIANISCTSTDLPDKNPKFTYTELRLTSNSLNSSKESCLSPDITSTSADLHDQTDGFSTRDGNSAETRLIYENIHTNTGFLNGTYCTQEYMDFSECDAAENITQSNLESGSGGEEIYIEDHVIMGHDSELPFFDEVEVQTVGANVDVRTDTTFEEDSTVNSLSPSATRISSGPKNGEKYDHSLAEKLWDGLQGKAAPTSTPVVSPFKDLRVDVEKINLPNCKNLDKFKNINTKKIMFTSPKKLTASLEEFNKFEVTNHMQYEKLKEKHDLDDILSGPILKLNGRISNTNPYKNFDLFDSKTSSSLERTPTSSSANTSIEVTSPAYEGIDDFRSYFEESKNSNIVEIPADNFSSDKAKSPVTMEKANNSVAIRLFPSSKVETVRSKAMDNQDTLKPIQQKAQAKKHIMFADDVIELENMHSPVENVSALQGILKKTSFFEPKTNRLNSGKKVTRPRIPRRLMNLKSFALYNVKPNDPCIQSELRVVVKKLSDSEISSWRELSEFSRLIQIKKQPNQCSLSVLRVDYNSTEMCFQRPLGTTKISIPEPWRSNVSLESKPSSPNEGSNLYQLPYTEKKNGKRKREGNLNMQSPHDKKKKPGGYNSLAVPTEKRRPGRPRKKT